MSEQNHYPRCPTCGAYELVINNCARCFVCDTTREIYTPQPATTGTEARVCADIAARQAKGIAKYGTTVESNPASLKEWLQHAYEETLDKAVYLKRAIEEMEK